MAPLRAGDTDDLIGLDRYEFTRMLKELTGGGRYGTSEDFQEWADSQFRLADGDFDGVVCRDEFVMFYWKKIIFLFPPVKVISSDIIGKDICCYDTTCNTGPRLPSDQLLVLSAVLQGAKAANRLYDIFVDFCSEGSTVRQEAMGFTRWRRVCTLCRLISPGRLSAGDVDIAFKSIVGRKRSKECCTRPSCCCGAMKAKNELDYDQFLEALSLVAGEKAGALTSGEVE